MTESRLYDAQAEAVYQEHARRTARINEHDWKNPVRPRRSLRAVLATALLALAVRIAPPHPETDVAVEAITDGVGV